MKAAAEEVVDAAWDEVSVGPRPDGRGLAGAGNGSDSSGMFVAPEYLPGPSRYARHAAQADISSMVPLAQSALYGCETVIQGGPTHAALVARGAYRSLPMEVRFLWRRDVAAAAVLEINVVTQCSGLWLYFGTNPQRGLPRCVLQDPRLAGFALCGAPPEWIRQVIDPGLEFRLGEFAEGAAPYLESIVVHGGQVGVEVSGWPADHPSLLLLLDLVAELDARARWAAQGMASTQPQPSQGPAAPQDLPWSAPTTTITMAPATPGDGAAAMGSAPSGPTSSSGRRHMASMVQVTRNPKFRLALGVATSLALGLGLLYLAARG